MSAPKTIMIVEDEAMIAVHIEVTLTEFGHHVITAATVAEAERLAEAGGIDLAIVDYRLSDGTSETLMGRLQREGVPFIACSGLDEGGRRNAAGEPRYLAKPFTSEALVEAVSAMIGVQRGQHEVH